MAVAVGVARGGRAASLRRRRPRRAAPATNTAASSGANTTSTIAARISRPRSPPRTRPRPRSRPPTTAPRTRASTRRPTVTIAVTLAASGLRSSRLGPTAPDAPAAASVWQLAHEDANTAAPGSRRRRRRAAPTSFLRRPSQLRPREQRDDDQRGGQPRDPRQHSIRHGQHYGAGKPFSEMNHSPLVIHVADEHAEDHPAGQRQRQPGQRVRAHDHDLDRERAVERAAEDRMQQDARRRVLERELVEAVVGDREAEQEREPPRHPMHAAPASRRRRAADLPVQPQRRAELDQREQHRQRSPARPSS